MNTLFSNSVLCYYNGVHGNSVPLKINV